jgi:hypothetical protein
MYAILVLAASLPTVVLEGRLLTVNVPANVHLKHQGVNLDTAEYDFYSGTDSATFLTVIAGAGATELYSCEISSIRL